MSKYIPWILVVLVICISVITAQFFNNAQHHHIANTLQQQQQQQSQQQHINQVMSNNGNNNLFQQQQQQQFFAMQHHQHAQQQQLLHMFNTAQHQQHQQRQPTQHFNSLQFHQLQQQRQGNLFSHQPQQHHQQQQQQPLKAMHTMNTMNTLDESTWKPIDKDSPAAFFKITSSPDIILPSATEELTFDMPHVVQSNNSPPNFPHVIRFGFRRILYNEKETDYVDVFFMVEPPSTSPSLAITSANANTYQLDFATLHFIAPTTPDLTTATRVSPQIVILNEKSAKNMLTSNSYQIYKNPTPLHIPTGHSVRFAFTYRFKQYSINPSGNGNNALTTATANLGANQNNRQITDQTILKYVYETPVFYQTTSGTLGADNSANLPELLTFSQTLLNLNQGSAFTGDTTNGNNSSGGGDDAPIKKKPVPDVNSVEDFRTLTVGAWKSTKTCKSSSKCCCLHSTKATTVLLAEDVAAGKYTEFKIKDEEKEKLTKNSIFVHSYLDGAATSCFGISSLSGICELDKNSMEGKCVMNGVKLTAKLVKDELVVTNSMYPTNCDSIAIKD